MWRAPFYDFRWFIETKSTGELFHVVVKSFLICLKDKTHHSNVSKNLKDLSCQTVVFIQVQIAKDAPLLRLPPDGVPSNFGCVWLSSSYAWIIITSNAVIKASHLPNNQGKSIKTRQVTVFILCLMNEIRCLTAQLRSLKNYF